MDGTALNWLDSAGAVTDLTAAGGSGKLLPRVLVTAATYSVLTTDLLVAVDFAGAVTLTLPAASAAGTGTVFRIVDEGGNAGSDNITVDTTGGDTINGQADALLNVSYSSLSVYAVSGTGYFVF